MDTSITVRYITGDPPDMAEQAAQIIDKTDNLKITEGVLSETAFVLSSVYRMPREQVIDCLIALVQMDNISTYAIDERFVLEGLYKCRPSGRYLLQMR